MGVDDVLLAGEELGLDCDWLIKRTPRWLSSTVRRDDDRRNKSDNERFFSPDIIIIIIFVITTHQSRNI